MKIAAALLREEALPSSGTDRPEELLAFLLKRLLLFIPSSFPPAGCCVRRSQELRLSFERLVLILPIVLPESLGCGLCCQHLRLMKAGHRIIMPEQILRLRSRSDHLAKEAAVQLLRSSTGKLTLAATWLAPHQQGPACGQGHFYGQSGFLIKDMEAFFP